MAKHTKGVPVATIPDDQAVRKLDGLSRLLCELRGRAIHKKEWPKFAREVAWLEPELAGFTVREKMAANKIFERLWGPLWKRWQVGQTTQALTNYVDFVALQIRIARLKAAIAQEPTG
jgi:hypothetical protein